MCFGGGAKPIIQQAAKVPVRAMNVAEELAPTIELSSEDALELAKKKKSKKGTLGMQTDLNIISGGTDVNTG